MTNCPACDSHQPHAATCTACGYDINRHVRQDEDPSATTDTMYRDYLLRLNRLQPPVGAEPGEEGR